MIDVSPSTSAIGAGSRGVCADQAVLQAISTNAGVNNKMPSNVNFAHVNIRSWLKISSTGSRIDRMYDFVEHNDITVLALTETHLSELVDDSEISMNDFQFFRRDRKRRLGAGVGGGVGFFVSPDIPVQVLQDLSIDDLETLWILVRFGEKT